MWQLGLALSALTIGSALLRERCHFGVAAVLLANWVVNTGYVSVTGETYPWGFFLATDYLSGVFAVAGLGLICGRFTVGSVFIAFTYAGACIVHAAYGLSDHGPWPQYRYWWTLFYIALGQMMFVTGWGVYELARRRHRAPRGVAPDTPGLAGAGGTSPVVEP